MCVLVACVQVVETYSEELGLGKPDSGHSHVIVAAHGAKKLAAVVAAVRTVQFMDRCACVLGTRVLRHFLVSDAEVFQAGAPVVLSLCVPT
jgi:hypothetical protein